MTLTPRVAGAVRRMAHEMGDEVGPTEVVRRGLVLLDLYLSLGEHEELVVRDRLSGGIERLRVVWDALG